MSYAAAIDLSCARTTLVAAIAWRAVAELSRRQSPELEPRVVQYHPGISMRGVIGLRLHKPGQRECSAGADFMLGGPSGMWNPLDNFNEEHSLAGMLGNSPASELSRMETALCLRPPPGELAPSTRRVLGLRLVAGLLERQVFSTVAWRASLGAHGWNGGTHVHDWHAALLGETYAPDKYGCVAKQYEERLSDLVLVHREPSDESPPDWRGLAIDLATGAVSIVGKLACSSVGDCAALYDKHGRSLRKLVSLLDERMQAA